MERTTDGYRTPRKPVGDKALDDDAIMQIEMNFYRGLYGDYEMRRLLESARTYRKVLRHLLSYFRKHPTEPFYYADAVRDRSVAYLKELASMEDDE